MSFKDRNLNTSALLILYLTFIITPIAAWVTHVLRCIDTESWLFLIAGAIAVPIGIIHGLGIWFGAF